MRADAYPLDTVLGERQQWVVPVYQRHYAWETGEDKATPKGFFQPLRKSFGVTAVWMAQSNLDRCVRHRMYKRVLSVAAER